MWFISPLAALENKKETQKLSVNKDIHLAVYHVPPPSEERHEKRILEDLDQKEKQITEAHS